MVKVLLRLGFFPNLNLLKDWFISKLLKVLDFPRKAGKNWQKFPFQEPREVKEGRLI